MSYCVINETADGTHLNAYGNLEYDFSYSARSGAYSGIVEVQEDYGAGEEEEFGNMVFSGWYKKAMEGGLNHYTGTL